MSEKIKKNEKAKKQTWRAGNMLYPVPAVIVSCARKREKPNIITVAWPGTVCSDPAMVSISVRKERYSHEIIKETGEFVINLTTRKLTRATDYCGVKSGRDVDKFAYPGFTRKIYLKGLRYNQHLRARSALVEVGAQTNTFEEACNAMMPLAELLDMVLQGK